MRKIITHSQFSVNYHSPNDSKHVKVRETSTKNSSVKLLRRQTLERHKSNAWGQSE